MYCFSFQLVLIPFFLHEKLTYQDLGLIPVLFSCSTDIFFHELKFAKGNVLWQTVPFAHLDSTVILYILNTNLPWSDKNNAQLR